jgi:hypothetical protein
MPPKRRRRTPWLTEHREGRVLPELRALYQAITALGGPSYYEIARSRGLNATTVQRVLACTGVQRPATGRAITNIEAIADGLGHALTLVPTAILPQVRALILAHHAAHAQAAHQQTLWGHHGNSTDL